MRSEDPLTRCPNCKGSLTWKSHSTAYLNDHPVHEFTFRCEPCNREYLYRDGELQEKRMGRDEYAEAKAMLHGELEAALNRRCPTCGGPLNDGHASLILRCEWCHQEYVTREGELSPRPPEPKRKPLLRELANAVHA